MMIILLSPGSERLAERFPRGILGVFFKITRVVTVNPVAEPDAAKAVSGRGW
jgi:hypothetical protein